MTARLAAEPPTARLHSRSRLVFDTQHGRTRLAVRDLGAPLRVMRGFELPDGRLLVQVISAAPGFFSGDRYEIEIEVRSGAVLAPNVVLGNVLRAVVPLDDEARRCLVDMWYSDGPQLFGLLHDRLSFCLIRSYVCATDSAPIVVGVK